MVKTNVSDIIRDILFPLEKGTLTLSRTVSSFKGPVGKLRKNLWRMIHSELKTMVVAWMMAVQKSIVIQSGIPKKAKCRLQKTKKKIFDFYVFL